MAGAPVLQWLAVAGIAMISASCQMIKSTFAMEHRLFVRVPCEPKETAKSKDGWHFRRVAQGPQKERPHDPERPSQWYVVWRMEDDGRDRVTRSGLLPPWGTARAMAPEVARAAKEALGEYPNLVEPGLVFKQSVAVAKDKNVPRTPPGVKPGGIPEMEVRETPRRVWPSKKDAQGYYEVGWHLDDDHTQLKTARKIARETPGSNPGAIKIGILDTGMDGRQVGMPRNVEWNPKADAVQALRPEFDRCEAGMTDASGRCLVRTTPGDALTAEHGTGAIGILAGTKVRVVDRDHTLGQAVAMKADGSGYEVELGASPDAQIFPVRVANGPASLGAANLAYAIDYASRVKKCDVISMSHGGSPSQLWADTVNAAYQRGTAMFAATGDYFTLPVPGALGRTGIILPSSTVYPAGWRRVMGVAGVTHGDKPYALTDWKRFLTGFWDLRNITHHFMRGSYGADGVRRSIFFSDRNRETANTDRDMVIRKNVLRANPVCTYTHGIPWLEEGKPKAGAWPNEVSLSGSGTSSSAPQAAAAAAHWLAVHRKELEAQGVWKADGTADWRKAEATYLAMAYSASRPWAKESRKEDQQPDPAGFRGAGILKAADMLNVSYAKTKQLKGETLRFPHDGTYIDEKGNLRHFFGDKHGVAMDFFDGNRSTFANVFDALRSDVVDQRNRAQLREKAVKNESEALTQIFYNMLLDDAWQHGRTPEWKTDCRRKIDYSIPEMKEAEAQAKAALLKAKEQTKTTDQEPKRSLFKRLFSARP